MRFGTPYPNRDTQQEHDPQNSEEFSTRPVPTSTTTYSGSGAISDRSPEAVSTAPNKFRVHTIITPIQEVHTSRFAPGCTAGDAETNNQKDPAVTQKKVLFEDAILDISHMPCFPPSPVRTRFNI